MYKEMENYEHKDETSRRNKKKGVKKRNTISDSDSLETQSQRLEQYRNDLL